MTRTHERKLTDMLYRYIAGFNGAKNKKEKKLLSLKIFYLEEFISILYPECKLFIQCATADFYTGYRLITKKHSIDYCNCFKRR